MCCICSGEATASGDKARVWELPGGRQVAQVAHEDWVQGGGVYGVAFSADRRLLATASGDKTRAVGVAVVRLATGALSTKSRFSRQA